jgi:predicted ester cyclase
VTEPTDLVRRLVDDVINGEQLDLLDELCASRLALRLRNAFTQFRAAFPDWQQSIVEVVSDGETVVARMRCTGTQAGEWLGLAPTGRRMKIDEVYFFYVEGGRIARVRGLEDTWTRMQQLRGTGAESSEPGELGSLG